MNHFDVIASTMRDGVAVDTIEFAIEGAPPATAYLLGDDPGRLQPVVIGLHDERGDKATLLSELGILAKKGFLCLTVDSPGTRLGVADRDPLDAFESMLAIGVEGLRLLQSQPEVLEGSVALIGRGIGGEVAGRMAAVNQRVRVVVSVGALPKRSEFVAMSNHALAGGIRHFRGEAETARMVDGLAQHDLVAQLAATPDTSWLMQLADDDDRLSDNDRTTLALSIPRTVRVAWHHSVDELRQTQARRERLDFITHLCR